ncbi:unnamed protein product [Mucor hiemalis]
MSDNNNNSDKKYSSKSCYRLYAGHGNWINLNHKTTQDLLQIFRAGAPCRYPLAEGLAIDIIPNDVDCNSKNIDMFGLMRADLVYETQADEHNVQQLMSHYIRSLLDEQGIIDAFPPLRTGEDLPIVTSIPTHRHLSMVPSVIGTVRRGPKPNSFKKSNNSSSSSSSTTQTGGPTVDHSLVSSSISSSSSSSPSRTRRKSSYSISTRRSTAAANSSNNKKLKELDQLPTATHAIMPTEMHNYVQLYDHQQPHYLDMNPSPTNSSHTEYHQQQQHNHHYGVNPMLPSGFNQHHHGEEGSSLWLPFQQQQQNSPATRSTAAFNFDFPMEEFERTTEEEVVERQSPTDILNEYEFTQQQHHHHRGFDADLYSSTTGTMLEDNHHHLPPSSDSTDSYVPPTSPWTQQQHYGNNIKKSNSITNSIDESTAHEEDNGANHLFRKVSGDLINTHAVTTLPMERLLLTSSNDKNNHTSGGLGLMLSHCDSESS